MPPQINLTPYHKIIRMIRQLPKSYFLFRHYILFAVNVGLRHVAEAFILFYSNFSSYQNFSVAISNFNYSFDQAQQVRDFQNDNYELGILEGAKLLLGFNDSSSITVFGKISTISKPEYTIPDARDLLKIPVYNVKSNKIK